MGEEDIDDMVLQVVDEYIVRKNSKHPTMLILNKLAYRLLRAYINRDVVDIDAPRVRHISAYRGMKVAIMQEHPDAPRDVMIIRVY